MTDKETLILAAKVAGIELDWDVPEKASPWRLDEDGDPADIWNPLTSNDDCFRLETALAISILWRHDRVYSGDHSIEYFKDHNGDKDKARRYASTRAAALIGRE